MTLSSFVLLLPMLLSLATAQDDTQGDEPQPVVRRLIVERQLLLRVPVRPRPAMQRFNWIGGKRFRCVHTSAIRGALLAGPDHVDFLLPQRRRIRATFDGNCPALDFYGGFYLKTEDHRLCIRRDSVHSRMGGSCRIESFQSLVPKVKG